MIRDIEHLGPHSDVLSGMRLVTVSEVLQEAEVLAAAVALEPGEHYQRDVESHIVKQVLTSIQLLLQIINL